MLNNIHYGYVNDWQVPPTGNTYQLEFDGKNSVQAKDKVFLNIVGDSSSKSEDCMCKCRGCSLGKHWQTHQTRGDCAKPQRFET